MDRISNLPAGIIETILCFLSLKEAARTSILSKEWRYHWLKIPKLVFDANTFHALTFRAELSVLDQPSERKSMLKRCRIFYDIYQVLLIHQGPIHEFTLSVEAVDSCVEFDHIILHLWKINSLKILRLNFYNRDYEKGYILPISIFLLHQLTDMYLYDCCLFHEGSLSDFGCLTTLYLEKFWTCDKTLLRLLSGCPLLKKLTLNVTWMFDSGDSTIVDLFKCLPVIEYLYVSITIVEHFVPDYLPKELPAALVHLKYLCVEWVWFSHKYAVPFLALLIRSSPNLKKLKLVMFSSPWLEEDEVGSFTLEDYSNIMFEHLSELEILDFSDAKNELDFVKLVLAKSPVLKKVRIFPHHNFDEAEESHISKILLCSPRASHVVKITVKRENPSSDPFDSFLPFMLAV